MTSLDNTVESHILGHTKLRETKIVQENSSFRSIACIKLQVCKGNRLLAIDN